MRGGWVDASRTLPCPRDAGQLESAVPKTAGCRNRDRNGEVSEWLKEHAWKVCKRLNRASGVRIPLSPPVSKQVVFDAAPKFGDTPKRGDESPCGFDRSAGLPICTAKPPGGRGTRMYRVHPPLSASFNASQTQRLWWPRRPLATLDRKLRQGRKAATVSVDAGAEVSRRGHRHFVETNAPEVVSAPCCGGFCNDKRCRSEPGRMGKPSGYCFFFRTYMTSA